jgi:hypothetical protein
MAGNHVRHLGSVDPRGVRDEQAEVNVDLAFALGGERNAGRMTRRVVKHVTAVGDPGHAPRGVNPHALGGHEQVLGGDPGGSNPYNVRLGLALRHTQPSKAADGPPEEVQDVEADPGTGTRRFSGR